MVDRSTVILGVYNKDINSVGTKKALNYAIKSKKEIIILEPNTLEIYKTLVLEL